jgi:Ca2+-binding RTX toxin-like protein
VVRTVRNCKGFASDRVIRVYSCAGTYHRALAPLFLGTAAARRCGTRHEESLMRMVRSRVLLAATVVAGVAGLAGPAAAAPAAEPTPVPIAPGFVTPPVLGWPLLHSCDGKPATIVGTSGADTLVGTPYDDVIVALGGNDTVRGLGGADTICAGTGTDIVFGDVQYPSGSDGTNRVFGGTGNDFLLGGASKDLLVGDDGNDYLWGDAGSDTMQGKSGDDVLIGRQGLDYHEGGEGADELDAAQGDDGSYDMVYGGPGNDILRTRDGKGNDVGDYGGGWDGCAKDAGDAITGCHFLL